MKNNLSKLKKKKKGFTLIELIVVIAILGVLAAIAIPRLTGFIGTSKTSADVATAKTITTAAMTAYSNNELALSGTTGPWKIDITAAGTATGTNVVSVPEATGVTAVLQKYLGTSLPLPQDPTKTKFTITFDVNGGATTAAN